MNYDKGHLMQQADEYRVLFLQAADYIEKHGHCKHQMKSGEQVCAVTAILIAAGQEIDGFVIHDLKPVVLQTLLKLTNHIGRDPVRWNDDPHTTAEEVTETFRTIAKKGEHHDASSAA